MSSSALTMPKGGQEPGDGWFAHECSWLELQKSCNLLSPTSYWGPPIFPMYMLPIPPTQHCKSSKDQIFLSEPLHGLKKKKGKEETVNHEALQSSQLAFKINMPREVTSQRIRKFQWSPAQFLVDFLARGGGWGPASVIRKSFVTGGQRTGRQRRDNNWWLGARAFQKGLSWGAGGHRPVAFARWSPRPCHSIPGALLFHPKGPRSHGALSTPSHTPSQRRGFLLKSGSHRTTAEFREVSSCFFSSFLLSLSPFLSVCLSFFQRKEWSGISWQAGEDTKFLSGRDAQSHNLHTFSLATELIKPEANGKLRSRNLRPKVLYLERDQHFS